MRTTVKKLVKIELVVLVAMLIGGAALGTAAFNKLSGVIKIVSASQAEKFRMSALHIGNPNSRGSAVYMQDGLALSAAHVCSDVQPGISVATDYKGAQIAIESVEMDEQVDICIIKLGNMPNELPTRDLAKSSFFLLGQTIITAGFPGGTYYSIQFATIKAIQMVSVYGANEPKQVSMIDAYVAPGGSGSGAFNDSGDVVGIIIVSSPMMGASGMVPLDSIVSFLEESALGHALVN